MTPEYRQKVKEMKLLTKTCIKYSTLAYTPTKSSEGRISGNLPSPLIRISRLIVVPRVLEYLL